MTTRFEELASAHGTAVGPKASAKETSAAKSVVSTSALAQAATVAAEAAATCALPEFSPQNEQATNLSCKVQRVPRSKSELKKDRLIAASLSSKQKADSIGYKYPLPWTTKEALGQDASSLQGLTGTKLTLLSRIASVADAHGRRFVSACSQRDCMKRVCPFDNCAFVARICFRVKGNEESQWILKEYRDHTCDVSISAASMKPRCEGRPSTEAKCCNFTPTSMEKPMLAPALVPGCILNPNMKPKEASQILQNYVVRHLPQPFVSSTLKQAKAIAFAGDSTREVRVSEVHVAKRARSKCE
jgi:hypothetical protein